jgi:hypothetical protein
MVGWYWQGKIVSNRRHACSNATFFTTIPTGNGLGLNPCLRGERSHSRLVKFTTHLHLRSRLKECLGQYLTPQYSYAFKVLYLSTEISLTSLVLNERVNLWTNRGQTFLSTKDIYGGADTASTSTVFVICWSPYIVFDLLQVYGHVPRTQTNIAVASFIQSLAPLNSAANPVIYCLFSTTIGRTLRQVQSPTLQFVLVLNNNCFRWRRE